MTTYIMIAKMTRAEKVQRLKAIEIEIDRMPREADLYGLFASPRYQALIREWEMINALI